ncbi:hypothetical protein V6N13_101464 [Hibiscus sabdariffa]|uniref:BZIP domain-containing protein n=1 Tax=Hibiscus sabdariffa TaxID=183260 RepID=A0ABR2QLE3_9ROSI
MASSSSGSSTATALTGNSGSSEEDLQALMEERKRKRMASNRESARRSRMRKREQSDELMATVTRLRKQNQDIVAAVNFTAQQLLDVEAENSVLRARLGELSHRLESLNEIIGFMNDARLVEYNEPAVDSFLNPFNLAYLNQPNMAFADNMFQC